MTAKLHKFHSAVFPGQCKGDTLSVAVNPQSRCIMLDFYNLIEVSANQRYNKSGAIDYKCPQ